MAFFIQAGTGCHYPQYRPSRHSPSLNRSRWRCNPAIISYTLTVAMLILVSGWLADRFGTRKVFMLAVTLFTSVLWLALSTSLTELVIFRVLQGIGGAMMMPRRASGVITRLSAQRTAPRCSTL